MTTSKNMIMIKYRNKNREQYNLGQRKHNAKYYSQNKAAILEKKKGRESFQREWKRICRILI
jgi:hypothetical protein